MGWQKKLCVHTNPFNMSKLPVKNASVNAQKQTPTTAQFFSFQPVAAAEDDSLETRSRNWHDGFVAYIKYNGKSESDVIGFCILKDCDYVDDDTSMSENRELLLFVRYKLL